jgi:predicted nucleotidyltransferase component of viral defense system
MIPMADILEWRSEHPWQGLDQVEQDLVLSRCLIELFLNSFLAKALVFRGGTALNKLFLSSPCRYSEDIDFVQIEAGPIGPIFKAVRERLDSILGQPSWKQGPSVCTLTYKFESEGAAAVPLRLKIEINTREHFSIAKTLEKDFEVRSRWFTGSRRVQVYSLDELLGTKMRALYQRKKGRDLLDLWLGLTRTKADPVKIVHIFNQYMERFGRKVTRQLYEQNLKAKMKDPGFLSDVDPLIRDDVDYDPQSAFEIALEKLVSQLR